MTEETTMPSGLKYKDEVVGTGESPKQGKQVRVHYTGRLTDGKKFDSSVDRGQPFTFTIGVGQVIKGWDEGVATMKVGGKRQLMIPPSLGYGGGGARKSAGRGGFCRAIERYRKSIAAARSFRAGDTARRMSDCFPSSVSRYAACCSRTSSSTAPPVVPASTIARQRPGFRRAKPTAVRPPIDCATMPACSIPRWSSRSRRSSWNPRRPSAASPAA